MSAFAGLHIDNAIVELDSDEVPINRSDSLVGPRSPPAIHGINDEGSEIPKLVEEIVLVNTTDVAL